MEKLDPVSQSAGRLGHLGIGPSVESIANIRARVHQLLQIHALHGKKIQTLVPVLPQRQLASLGEPGRGEAA